MPTIFISYRRQDTEFIARQVYDTLVSKFGQDDVIFDVDSIPKGIDFSTYLSQTVERCDILLALIGNGWLGFEEPGERRIDAPDDWVHFEIRTALERGIPVIPVLAGTNAKLPTREELPEGLKPLAPLQYATVRPGRDTRGDLRQLAKDIDQRLQLETPDAQHVRKAKALTPHLLKGFAILTSLAAVTYAAMTAPSWLPNTQSESMPTADFGSWSQQGAFGDFAERDSLKLKKPTQNRLDAILQSTDALTQSQVTDIINALIVFAPTDTETSSDFPDFESQLDLTYAISRLGFSESARRLLNHLEDQLAIDNDRRRRRLYQLARFALTAGDVNQRLSAIDAPASQKDLSGIPLLVVCIDAACGRTSLNISSLEKLKESASADHARLALLVLSNNQIIERFKELTEDDRIEALSLGEVPSEYKQCHGSGQYHESHNAYFVLMDPDLNVVLRGNSMENSKLDIEYRVRSIDRLPNPFPESKVE